MAIVGSDLILVCLVPAPRDLEIARLLGWYRIPLRSAPKVVAVDRLAFYQPGSFGDHGSRIEYTATVQGHELTTRADLLKEESQHPRAREEYFRLQLGPLESLAMPILAGSWKRITFFYTTGDYLLRARTVNDLVVDSGERLLLWKSLRERAAAGQAYQAEIPAADLPEDTLIALLGLREAPPDFSAADLE